MNPIMEILERKLSDTELEMLDKLPFSMLQDYMTGRTDRETVRQRRLIKTLMPDIVREEYTRRFDKEDGK